MKKASSGKGFGKMAAKAPVAKMKMGGGVKKPAPISAPGGTNLNGMKRPNKMS